MTLKDLPSQMELTHRMLAYVQVLMLSAPTGPGIAEVVARLERIEAYLIERFTR